jgi:hypothetical protein
MQQMLLIALVEVLLLMLIAFIVLLSLNWRRKKRRLAALNQLIDDVTDRQGLRKQKLSAKLSKEFKLSNQSAQVLSEVLVTAEKQFLQQFIEQEMTESVVGFYENLCKLLENYMQIMAESAEHAALSVQSQSSTELEPAAEENYPEQVSSIFGEQAPDWGDVFD